MGRSTGKAGPGERGGSAVDGDVDDAAAVVGVGAVDVDDNKDGGGDVPLLSIVIPAYNEEERIAPMLDAAYHYLTNATAPAPAAEPAQTACPAIRRLLSIQRQGQEQQREPPPNDAVVVVTIEWVVVSDGSTDRTRDVFLEYARAKRFHSVPPIPNGTDDVEEDNNNNNNGKKKKKKKKKKTGNRKTGCANTAGRQSRASASPSSQSRSPSSPPPDEDPAVVARAGVRHRARVVEYFPNRGKGAAVKEGMLAATGSYRLMVDADGATNFACLSDLVAHIQEYPTVWGSRAHLRNSEEVKRRSAVRNFLMQCFNLLVKVLCGAYIRDTQCGFKLFTARASRQLFEALHLQRWAFDTELVVRCNLLNLRVKEVDVDWHEIDGSKLNTSPYNLAWVAVTMLRDILLVRICYTLGIWKLSATSSASKTTTALSPTSTSASIDHKNKDN